MWSPVLKKRLIVKPLYRRRSWWVDRGQLGLVAAKAVGLSWRGGWALGKLVLVSCYWLAKTTLKLGGPKLLAAVLAVVLLATVFRRSELVIVVTVLVVAGRLCQVIKEPLGAASGG